MFCRATPPKPALLTTISSRYGKTPTPTSPSSAKLKPNSLSYTNRALGECSKGCRSDPRIGRPRGSKESAIYESSRSNPFGTHRLLQKSLPKGGVYGTRIISLKRLRAFPHRGSRDHAQRADLGQLGDQLVRHPIGKVFLLGVLGEILEWQHSDGLDPWRNPLAEQPLAHTTDVQAEDRDGERSQANESEEAIAGAGLCCFGRNNLGFRG